AGGETQKITHQQPPQQGPKKLEKKKNLQKKAVNGHKKNHKNKNKKPQQTSIKFIKWVPNNLFTQVKITKNCFIGHKKNNPLR
ncbi:hypothetical protein L2E23_25120, partial [Salmonella enterica subsp. enterica serovar Weltevreden]|uniref:hypothetical protein n=1 Tax=Salmonella enterica TaxID=28901 RepID=UPI001F1E5D3E